ncbi:macro domain-containing protein [Plantactinospora solaniradicis]|uniref:Macro domain-containing protein n=1 Tax=Plantactinospora solaniradicis TaxID=1723736 RepID=A0ABW1KLN4_9ACTN
MPVVTAVLGDITTEVVDAVVNAANEAMRGGGGVDGAVHRSGGPAVLRDCIARFPNGLATGDAGWTTAGDLPARWIIHTVGPNYHAGQRDRSLLVSCYRRVLKVADEIGARTVAFPLISTGVFGWPRADAIATAIETLAAASTRVDEVRLVAVEEAVHKQIRAALWLRCPPPVGTGTVGSLFEREPTQFGLRGDSYLWRELRARFAHTPLPDHWFTLRTLLTDTIEQVVGEPLVSRESTPWHDKSAAIHVPEFDPGHGMSAGAVHLPWWVHTGVPILLDRYAAQREPDAAPTLAPANSVAFRWPSPLTAELT